MKNEREATTAELVEVTEIRPITPSEQILAIDFYDYAGVHRSFNVRVYANDIWIGNHPSALDKLQKRLGGNHYPSALGNVPQLFEPPVPIAEPVTQPVTQPEPKAPVLPQSVELDLADAPDYLKRYFGFTTNIPETMKQEPRWCVWKKHDDGRKIPYTVLEGRYWSTGQWGKSDTPSTWAPFDEALCCYMNAKGNLDGLSFALGDGYCGFDFDDVVGNGQTHPQALSWLAKLAGYEEPSQSLTGIKCIVKGKIDKAFLGTAETGRQFKGIPAPGMATEVYDKRRFFFLTGFGSGQPHPNQTAIDAICNELQALKDSKQPKSKPKLKPRQNETPIGTRLNNDQVIEKARNSKNGDKFDRLWSGEIGSYDSHSEADMALTSILMFWCQNDVLQVEQLFAESGLAKRDKWDREDYRVRTLAKAHRSEVYQPRLPRDYERAAARIRRRNYG